MQELAELGGPDDRVTEVRPGPEIQCYQSPAELVAEGARQSSPPLGNGLVYRLGELPESLLVTEPLKLIGA